MARRISATCSQAASLNQGQFLVNITGHAKKIRTSIGVDLNNSKFYFDFDLKCTPQCAMKLKGAYDITIDSIILSI